MKYLVLDIETKYWAEEIEGGWGNIPGFGLAVAVTMDETGEWDSWFEDESHLLIEELTEAPLIITFNGINFDYEVLKPYGLKPEILYDKSFDILAEMKARLGHRVSLDSVAKATLGEGKSGEGIKAVEWFHEGKIEQVVEYCRQDVDLTRRIYEYIMEHGYCWFNSFKTSRTKCVFAVENE